ncbi:MAG: multicopper oxidase family protein [Lacisediminihabitans sp.]
MNNTRLVTHQFGRRAILGAGLAVASTAVLAACTASPTLISATSRAVLDAETARKGTGVVRKLTLRAAPSQLDLAGKTANTWSFGSVPAPVVRLSAGDTLRATVRNELPDETSVHWHGVALRNDMDGVPPITQSAIAPGKEFTYDFIAPHPGTYWFHPHVGVQIDRGLYGALVIDDPKEPLSYDEEWVVVLDDWLDGVTSSPDKVLAELSRGMGGGNMGGMFMRMGNMLMGTNSSLLGGDAGDVYYPSYLVNGRPPEDPQVYTAKPGTRVRIRLINAGGDTAFRVALGGHALTITHTDGFPVVPVDVDSVLIGMGERYDVVTTLGDGVFPFVASAEGKQASGFALVRTGGGQAPAPGVTLPELTKRVGTAGKLSASPEVRLASRKPDRQIALTLTGSMQKYDWAINGRRFDAKDPLKAAETVREGERVQVSFVNKTMMWHPMHLHGHTYQHPAGGPRKDTSIVLPGQTLRVDFDADNPGQWVAHCHNIYHAESGMMSVIAYQA